MQLTIVSTFLNHLTPGNTVLADQGFTIEEDIAMYGAKLEIPPFTRGKKQLSQRLSRIHVERIIGHLKNKFRSSKGSLPTSMLKHSGDNRIPKCLQSAVLCVI